MNKYGLLVILLLTASNMSSHAYASHASSRSPSSSMASEPSPTPSLDPGFLLLPAYDLEKAPATSEKHQVGDQIVLMLHDFAIPSGSSLPLKVDQPPGSGSLSDQGFELVAPETVSGKPGGPVELRLAVVPLKPGSLTLPSLAIQDTSGKSLGRTNPLPLSVESAIRKDDPEPQKPVDLRPPADLTFPWWFIAILGVAAVLLVAALGYWAYRWSRKTRIKPAVPNEPPRPEDEVALSALTQLEKSGALTRGEFKVYYFRVSEILKNYIGTRYSFDAPECTTRELIENLERSMRSELAVEAGSLATLIETFNQLDLVKFTDHVPAVTESVKLIPAARGFILATRRKQVSVAQTQTAGGAVDAPR